MTPTESAVAIFPTPLIETAELAARLDDPPLRLIECTTIQSPLPDWSDFRAESGGASPTPSREEATTIRTLARALAAALTLTLPAWATPVRASDPPALPGAGSPEPVGGFRLVADVAWASYRSVPGRFTVIAPGAPTERTVPVKTAGGATVNRVQVLFADLDPIAFAVMYSDYPANERVSLDQARDSGVQAVKGRLLRESPITLGGYAGRDLTIEIPEGQVARQRLFAVGQRLYQVIVIGPESQAALAVERFLTSFRLLGP